MSPAAGRRGQAPAAYPPPVADGEFVGAPAAAADERIEAGVVIVGAGPAGLACAIRLLQRREADPALAAALGEVPVAVLEKGRLTGGHQLSGAVMDPVSLAELLPDAGPGDWPHWGRVEHDAARVLLDGRRSLPVRPVPPPFRNRGNYVVSASELTRWLALRAEELGALVLTETPAQALLLDRGVARGVRTGDRGRDSAGEPGRVFQPGAEVHARATVLGDGATGHLSSAALEAFGLAAPDPRTWSLGVKEVWELPAPLEGVVHTLGWPLRAHPRWREFGGAWLYGMNRPGAPPMASIGFVAGLGHADAELSVHDLLQELKSHQLVRGILEGGRRVAWGAKAIPEGGWWALPRPHAPGLLLCGDAAGLVDVPRLKGIHHALQSGMLAAEQLHRGLVAGSGDFAGYERAIRRSRIGRDLWKSRNMRQPFDAGMVAGALAASAMTLTGGRFPGGHWRSRPDAATPLLRSHRAQRYPRPDGSYFFDKASSVFAAGHTSRADAPDHLRVQRRVPREVADAWSWMCPAGVYEVAAGAPEHGLVDLVVQPANCIQCGAIHAKGGRLTPPEGGSGPAYRLG